METFQGIAVYPGVVIGSALVYDTEGYLIPKKKVEVSRLEEEVGRLKTALREASAEARKNQEIINAKIGSQYGAILGAHAQMIEDPVLFSEIKGFVEKNRCTPEFAVCQILRKLIQELKAIADSHMASRALDLKDIEKQILSKLVGLRKQELSSLSEPVIILAHDLSPSETANLNPRMVQAFATEVGGRTSHTSILAGALEIPALVGLGKFIDKVADGDMLIVDGNAGLLIVNPDQDTLARYRGYETRNRSLEISLEALKELPAVTLDGHSIALLGNIEFPHESGHCLDKGADGIGLYRTEFLFIGKEQIPSEEEQFQAYREVVEAVGSNRPVVIRTLDLGGDKFGPYALTHNPEKNPFLGVRSIRLCLRNIELFKTQMRAILRASVYGDVRILFPMISTILELRQAKMVLAEVKEDLHDEGLAFRGDIPVGTMIEVPSAALLAEILAKEVSFFSIGTNDLVQYTLAADRSNEDVASLYNPGDPAVLRLIDMIVKAAGPAQVAVNVCGEMSGDPIYTILLLGLGVNTLSLSPHAIPEIKRVVRGISMEEARRVAQEAMRQQSARDVNNYLREQTRKVLPDPDGLAF
ncbi:MAG: phosphoenolpyruvate--protein phosphotransferase [Gemmataceae bacterium]|nr:phosphoenolpyruvate--protein phosphotransferase [Gemmataceae bacterium]